MSIHQPAPESRFAKSSHATVSTLKFIRTYQRTIPPRPGVAGFSVGGAEFAAPAFNEI
jgi:hypothetical protein